MYGKPSIKSQDGVKMTLAPMARCELQGLCGDGLRFAQTGGKGGGGGGSQMGRRVIQTLLSISDTKFSFFFL
jgi:hypothetical protein